MTIKSIQTLVSEAMQEIKTINADEALKMVEEDNCNLIDKKSKIIQIWDNVRVKDHAKEVLETLKGIIKQ